MLKFVQSSSVRCIIRTGNGVKDFWRFEATAPSIEKVSDSIKHVTQIPGYKPFPFIGTSWISFPIVGKYSPSKVHLYDRDKYYRFGDIARDVYSGMNVISCYNEKDYETVLKNESKMPIRTPLISLLKYRMSRKEWYQSVGVSLINNQEWYDLRFKLQKHMMKPRTVNRYIEPITKVTRDLCDRILYYRDNNKEMDNFQSELFKWALEAVAYISLEKRMGCLDMNSTSDGLLIIESMHTAFACMNEMENGSSLKLWKWLPTPAWNKFAKAQDQATEIAFREVKSSMDLLKAKSPSEQLDSQPTLLKDLLASPEIEPCEIMTTVMEILTGGTDTMANTAAFLLHHLATNSEKQEKLYQEIKRMLPSDDDVMTPEILSNMRYFKLCLKESMRLNPIARAMGRIISKDLILSGYHVPKGTYCILMMQVTGRLEKYFKNSDQFIPERWDERESKPSPHLVHPFGFGTRGCIGRRIAELELQTLIVTLLRKFKIEYHYGDIQITNRLLNCPDRPLKFTFLDRI